ncbi:MAG TPA: choice-of-anchor tandem repeat GloVer-containing protein, partial [Candidatus Binatia bacterium]|nr:choice-of-anchor tandem repeat GloVer-containing protein [Candidatus Binatia bacterium]
FPFLTVYGFSSLAANPEGVYTNRVGGYPSGGLILVNNLLYGSAQDGGTNGSGTVYTVNTKLTGSSAAYTFTLLRDVSQFETNSDGASPNGGLILSGNTLYGTASIGGTNGAGTVFAMNTNGSGFKILHTFSAPDPVAYTNNDGASPNGGLILSGNTLYGTTFDGGTNGIGTVFAVDTNGSGFNVLHTFSALGPVANTNGDGAGPNGGLIRSGNTLYGTANYGGDYGFGTVFEVGTNGMGFATLYNFTSGDDGASPYAGLVLASNVLYGTTSEGGYYDYGTIFAIKTNGANFSVLHVFSGADDGGYPSAGLILSGNTLYGSTESGGLTHSGVVFAMSTVASNLVALHEFTGGNEGVNPIGDLLLVGNTLYGTTTGGGANGYGTVFAVSTAPLSAAPQLFIVRDNANVI